MLYLYYYTTKVTKCQVPLFIKNVDILIQILYYIYVKRNKIYFREVLNIMKFNTYKNQDPAFYMHGLYDENVDTLNVEITGTTTFIIDYFDYVEAGCHPCCGELPHCKICRDKKLSICPETTLVYFWVLSNGKQHYLGSVEKKEFLKTLAKKAGDITLQDILTDFSLWYLEQIKTDVFDMFNLTDKRYTSDVLLPKFFGQYNSPVNTITKSKVTNNSIHIEEVL